MIEVEGLSCMLGGAPALRDVHFSVAAGEALGVVSDRPHSSHALMRALIGDLPLQQGDVRVNGLSARQHAAAIVRFIGYAPARPPTLPALTCREYLQLCAAGHGVPAAERDDLTRDLLELMELSHVAAHPANALSRELRQRLEIARALVHDPPALLLEDPFAHLDPRSSLELRDLIRELTEMGKAVLVSSPCAVEIADVCTHLMALVEDRVQWIGPRDAAANHVPFYRRLLVRFLGDPSLAQSLAAGQQGVQEVILAPTAAEGIPPGMVTLKEMRVHFSGDYAQANQLLRALMHSGVQLVFFGEER